MQKILIILFFTLSATLFSQEYLNKSEKYDLVMFQYLDSLTVANKTPIDEYLKFSKPFSKWDIRPVKFDKIWALDSIRTSSEISNFFWGGFSQHYELTQKEAGDKPNQFLSQGQIDEESNINFLNKNVDKFKTLSSLVLKGKNSIYLNQISLQRIDNLYKENDNYWSYSIPKNSPFPISSKIIREKESKYNSQQEKILDLMKQINIYAMVRTEKGIFFLLDGFTDNSYGYYFSKSKEIEMDNHLFEIMISKNINDGFFYYVAN